MTAQNPYTCIPQNSTTTTEAVILPKQQVYQWQRELLEDNTFTLTKLPISTAFPWLFHFSTSFLHKFHCTTLFSLKYTQACNILVSICSMYYSPFLPHPPLSNSPKTFIIINTTMLPEASRARERGYSRKFSIGVCRKGSWTLTLFKGKGRENGYLFKDRTRKMTPYSRDPNNG